MSLDIKQGDVLVYGGRDYPIQKCNPWSDPNTPDIAMKIICNLTASTKRAPSPNASKVRTSPVECLASIKISPIDPPSFATQQSIILQGSQAPANLRECFVDGGDTFYHLIVQELLI